MVGLSSGSPLEPIKSVSDSLQGDGVGVVVSAKVHIDNRNIKN